MQLVYKAIFTVCRDPDSKATVPELPGHHSPERPGQYQQGDFYLPEISNLFVDY